MPYIKANERDVIDRGSPPRQPGDLAYAISQLIQGYIMRSGLNYGTLHSIDGVLGTSQHEFRRRILEPYEDQKIQENGDVYDAVLRKLGAS